MEKNLEREFVWECDFGIRAPLKPIIKRLLKEQNSSQLQMVALFVNNNPYQLEFFIVLSYDNPDERQIEQMKQLFLDTGVKYRPDLSIQEFFSEMGMKRFNSCTLINEDQVDITFGNFFFFEEREMIARKISMKPLGQLTPVFLSHSSRDKLEVEEIIPYLNAAGLSVWFDKISIDYGEPIVRAIQNGVENSGAVIFWITKHFLQSNWCDTELELFLFKESSEKNLLIISIFANNITDNEREEFLKKYYFLKRFKYLVRDVDSSLLQVAHEVIPSLKKHILNKK